jgi:hypothetical protein
VYFVEAGCKRKGKLISFLPEDMEPWIFRGGIAAEMQVLLYVSFQDLRNIFGWYAEIAAFL